jgi:hypothetical protein
MTATRSALAARQRCVILRSPATSANRCDDFPATTHRFRLALKALDVAKLDARIVSLDLPLVFGDALVFKFDSGFAHAAFMTVLDRRG